MAGANSFPTFNVIDQGGTIRWQRVGNMDLAGAEVILQEVDKLLAAPAAGGGV